MLETRAAPARLYDGLYQIDTQSLRTFLEARP